MPPAQSQRLRIALVGTRGVPARYGGFETALEEVGKRLAATGHDVVVYCRTGNSRSGEDPDRYLGMQLVHLPATRKRTLETLSHTFLSALDAMRRRRFDAIVLCNAANAAAVPLLRLRGPVAVHVDGLEWRRAKWGPLGQAFYRVSEALSVRWADALIADAYGIERYYEDEFGARTVGIAYGAPDLGEVGDDKLAEVGVKKHEFHVLVARFEPENHVDLMIEGYLASNAQLPLLVVGSTPYPGEYDEKIKALAARSDRVHLLGGVWDQDLLDQLYANALTYLHGHSVGGTNPSLLRAMGTGTQTIAYDVVFNREVAGPTALYGSTPAQIARDLDAAEADVQETVRRGEVLAVRARELYDWDHVAAQYAELCRRMAEGESSRGRYSGRRNPASPWHGHETPDISVPSQPQRPVESHQAG